MMGSNVFVKFENYNKCLFLKSLAFFNLKLHMKNAIFYLLIMVCTLNGCTLKKHDYYPDTSSYASPKGTEVFKPDSASIADHCRVPEWFRDAKFGIFIHWGLYAVPAFYNEWYASRMYDVGSESYKHHIETYGKQTEFGYKDFIPMLKAEKFDANEWVSLFKAAGARYVVPVAEHHDRFAMYNAISLDWNPSGVVIHSINDDINVKEVSMLGSDEKLSWKQTKDGLQVSFPVKKPSEFAHVLKIRI